MNETPELLMPAGDMAKMKFAFAFGADAVYLGIPRFSLRARENGFKKLEQVAQAIDYAHALGKKVYVTANIFPHNSKLPSFVTYIKELLDLCKPDAWIMSDPGLIMLMMENFPQEIVHISVQSNTLNYASVKFWQKIGAKRIIVSREISIKEMKEIKESCPQMELESFVHGAICMAYSGRCLISNYLSHRDSNQGICTNSCRWEYKVYKTGDVQSDACCKDDNPNKTETPQGNDYVPLKDQFYLKEAERPDELFELDEDEHGSYLMNSKDLCAIDALKDLHEAGVCSFKVEGRSKSVYYVAMIARAYRRAIDDVVAGRPFNHEHLRDVFATSNRGFIEGFLYGNPGVKGQEYINSSSLYSAYKFIAVTGEYDANAKRLKLEMRNAIHVGSTYEICTPTLLMVVVIRVGLPVTSIPVNLRLSAKPLKNLIQVRSSLRNNMNLQIQTETSRRRTFAIISHPDAGKTTLTEKLLLYGGALGLAGSVTANKKQRDTASDWMELEKKRGISISSTVLQFDYQGYRLNLLDTPGHKDFSEDTYRVLMAVDSVVMVIDAGKGIENQTRKLFEICRKRGIPIFTFINKLDRPSMPPLELMDQIEKVLNLKAYPINWPLGNGPDFKGVYDRLASEVHLFERLPGGGAYRAAVSVHDINDESVKAHIPQDIYAHVVEELEILNATQGDFDIDQVLAGKMTPVFFGSAANNFGIELLLKGFLEFSVGPTPRNSLAGLIPIEHPAFSAFVFKVQTNMNPMHRDKVVFVRICSGKFTRNIMVKHTRTGEDIRLSDSHNIFGRDREIVNEAYPGDIVGFVTKADLRIGDTISEDAKIVYGEIPRFAPEHFAFLENTVTSSYKSFRKGIGHLLSENIVQSFTLKVPKNAMPLLGAVGPLQFEVLQYRLKDEYQAESTLEMRPWKILRWVQTPLSEEEIVTILPNGAGLAFDDQERPAILFPTEWSWKYFKENHPTVELVDSPKQ